jgi:hypothetical protein
LRRDFRIGQFNFDTENLEFETPEPVFCDAGVEVGDRLVISFSPGLSPVETNPEECAAYAGRTFAWDIEGLDQHRLRLAAGSGRVLSGLISDEEFEASEVADPTSECFSGALAYSVRVPLGTYAVVGGISGYLHPWRAADDGTCEQDPNATVEWTGRAREWTLKTDQSVAICPPSNEEADEWFEGDYFENHAVRFRLLPGCIVDDEGAISVATTGERVRWRFNVTNSFTIRTTQICAGGSSTDCVNATYGYPRSLRWSKAENLIYIIDSGQQKVAPVNVISGRGNVEFF